MSPVRFENQPPVMLVNDRRDVGDKPPMNPFLRGLYPYDMLVHRPVRLALSPPPNKSAANVNSLGEVPNSTWFTNRIGVRDLSVEEIRRGPNEGHHPMAALPFRIVNSKAEGVAPGFQVEDARGVRYLLKFDEKGQPEYESGANMVVQRLLWALGYNVPEEYLINVRRSDILLTDDSRFEDVFGDRQMLPADVTAVLARSHRGLDGRYRGIASELVPGEPLGGFPQEGVRKEDPNDLVPHQLRRELRGLKAIFAWLKHTDVKTANTLDAWVEDPRLPDWHYVIHYLIDFGKALGSMGVVERNRDDGYTRIVDVEYFNRYLLTLGLWTGIWETFEAPGILGIGIYETEAYEPAEFKVRIPYLPIEIADDADGFWGAALLMRFSEEQLRAAVETAQYSDPRAEDYLVYALQYRQRKTALYWFRRANPLDRFRVETPSAGQARLCFDDLLLTYELAPVAERTEYRAVAYDWDGEPMEWQRRVAPTAAGSACFGGLSAGPSHEGYLIVRIETSRPGYDLYRPIEAHLAEDETGALRVIGLRRRSE